MKRIDRLRIAIERERKYRQENPFLIADIIEYVVLNDGTKRYIVYDENPVAGGYQIYNSKADAKAAAKRKHLPANYTGYVDETYVYLPCKGNQLPEQR